MSFNVLSNTENLENTTTIHIDKLLENNIRLQKNELSVNIKGYNIQKMKTYFKLKNYDVTSKNNTLIFNLKNNIAQYKTKSYDQAISIMSFFGFVFFILLLSLIGKNENPKFRKAT